MALENRISRRIVLASPLLALTACSSPESNSQQNVSDTPISPSNLASDKYGATTYNTQKVASEMDYLKESIQPFNGPKKKIFITGSTAGLGELSAQYLLKRGHDVVLHAKNTQREADVRLDIPEAKDVLIGDLSNLEETKKLAAQANALGPFDVVIHNAGVYGASSETMLNVNSLSQYMLTNLMDKPKTLIYVSSYTHKGCDLHAEGMMNGTPTVSYGDTKLQNLTLAMAIARLWPDVIVNATHPGWVPTKMGEMSGNPPDSLRDAYMAMTWLAEDSDPASQVTGKYFFHANDEETNIDPKVHDTQSQDKLLQGFAHLSGVELKG